MICLVACATDSNAGEDRLAAVSGITLPPTLRLDTARVRSAKLTPVISPTNAGDAGLIWTSDTPAVAKVDAAGVVSAVAAGKATITVKALGASASCTVYVFALWLDDSFEDGSTASWDLRPPNGPDGTFSVIADGDAHVLEYDAQLSGGVLATLTPAAFALLPSGDYYVEARIKPLTNATSGNKQLYLIARSQDDENWYGAGLNVQNSTASTQVEIAKMQNGTLSRPVQVKTPIAQDTSWYTVRFELEGDMLSVYLDGVLLKSTSDPQWSSGNIGLFTSNKSFEIDDVRIGDPRDRPVQLAIDASAWSTEAGDEAKQIHVTARRPAYEDGSYVDDTFSAVSSAPLVAAVSIDALTATITPRSAGQATITFSSGSDPTLTRALDVTVEPQFVQPSTTYSLSGKTSPSPLEPRAYPDTSLSITFDAPPSVGTSGSVRIFRASDDAPVDIIRAKDETDLIGYAGPDGQALRRSVYSDARIRVAGNSVVIVPHNAVLDFATEYYVAIADGLIDAVLGGAPFRGLGKQAGFRFATRSEPDASKTTLTVDDDGDAADFRSVQAALNFVMKYGPKDRAVTIEVKNGKYEELLFLRGRDNISIVGESRDGVVIQYRNYESLNAGSGASQGLASASPGGGRAVFLVEACDLLALDSLTLRNTMRRSGALSSQAETIYFNNDSGRLIAKNASFISEQDTLQLKGYAWFYQTLVEGNVDFIWGANHVALFEDSEIRSIPDSAAADRGFVVQARSVAQSDKGFVFLRSAFKHDPGVPSGANAATFLARSSGNPGAWDNVAVVDCDMDDHIHPLGWAYEVGGQPKSNPAISTAASGWREYGSNGPGGDMTQRKHGYALNADDIANGFSTRSQIFAANGGNSGWNPMP
jgi:pectate lyase